jgi:hypothetical protein
MIATKPTRRPAASATDLARQVETRAAELAGFLDGADLPAELELDTLASLAAADGLLAVAMRRIEAEGPGSSR